MASSDPIRTDPRARARSAYELGRLRMAAQGGLVVAPMALASLAGCQAPATTAGLAIALYFLVVGLLWRGRVYGRAVAPGLLAGAAPLVLPMALRASGHCCLGGVCWSACLVACVGGGLAAGMILAVRARALGESRGAFVLAAAPLAALAGSLGCVVVGAAGVVGMVAGMLLGAAPALVAVRRAS